MSRRTRRNHSPAFKAKVALAAIKGIAPVGLRPPYATPRNGNRWKAVVVNPSIGTETLFRPTRPPLTGHSGRYL
jgi:hypothetical protein